MDVGYKELCHIETIPKPSGLHSPGPETVMCGRDPGDFIDITITSCPPEVTFTLYTYLMIITSNMAMTSHTSEKWVSRLCNLHSQPFFQVRTVCGATISIFANFSMAEKLIPRAVCFSDVVQCHFSSPLQVYTCDSGACIDLANKCNSKIECLDESDETNCQYLEV